MKKCLLIALLTAVCVGAILTSSAQAGRFYWDAFPPWPACWDTSLNLKGVTYGNGRYVAVGEIGATSCDIETSLDGITWTQRTCPTGPLV